MELHAVFKNKEINISTDGQNNCINKKKENKCIITCSSVLLSVDIWLNSWMTESQQSSNLLKYLLFTVQPTALWFLSHVFSFYHSKGARSSQKGFQLRVWQVLPMTLWEKFVEFINATVNRVQDHVWIYKCSLRIFLTNCNKSSQFISMIYVHHMLNKPR